jgi:hypothetical protein
LLKLGQGRGARHVQIGAHLAGAHAIHFGIVELRIQRFAAAAGTLHELADLLVQRHLLEQCFRTGEGLRNGVTRARQQGDDKAGHSNAATRARQEKYPLDAVAGIYPKPWSE